MGGFDTQEHWMIRGSKGSIEYKDGGIEGDQKRDNLKMITHDFDMDKIDESFHSHDLKINWTESDMKPYPRDLEIGPAAQWKGDNSEDEFDNNVFILEEVKQCIESGGKIKPLRCFEDCLKTFALTMGAIESSKKGGKPIFLPDLWEIPR